MSQYSWRGDRPQLANLLFLYISFYLVGHNILIPDKIRSPVADRVQENFAGSSLPRMDAMKIRTLEQRPPLGWMSA
jgi:hypothetical protein